VSSSSPNAQTALVARQAADVDLLSGGRLRLGVGVGWNWVEYEALGQDFASRGRRMDEQIELLRRLWTEPLVSFDGEFDQVERAGLVPRPERPVPLWIGGFSEPAFRRGGRLGDGFLFAGGAESGVEGLRRVRYHLAEAERSSEGFRSELATRARTADDLLRTVERWNDAGGSGIWIVTMGLGLDSVEAHLDHVGAMRDALARG